MSEIVACVVDHPRRSVVVAGAVALAVAGVIGVVGLSQTAQERVSSRFVQEEGTYFRVAPRDVALPADALARVERLNGVTGVAAYARATTGAISRIGLADDPTHPVTRAAVASVSPNFLEVSRAELVEGGGLLDAAVAGDGPRVAVAGVRLARELRLPDLRTPPVVFVDGEQVLVVGVARGAFGIDIDRSLLVRSDAAEHPDELLVETVPGAVRQVMDEAVRVLSPNDPGGVVAEAPRPPDQLRRDVESDLGVLTLLLAALFPLASGLAITNVMLGAVLERTGEIGLKRAVGARRSDIVRQIVGENALLGVMGVGAGLGLGLTFLGAVSRWQGWVLQFDPWLLVVSPLAGMATAAAASLLPALKAARLDPAEALRAS